MKDLATISNTSGAYPAVIAVDDATGSGGLGTPLKKQWVNEMWGAFQALLFRAHITAPSGNEEAYNSSQVQTAMDTAYRTSAGVQRGLVLANDTGGDVTNDITISAGVALSAVAPYNPMVAAASWTKQINAAWAAGTAAGGRASATNLTGAKTFHVFMLAKPAAAGVAHAVDFGFDTDASATNLLADATGYTDYCMIGSILWDGAAIVLFRQIGDSFKLLNPAMNVGVAGTTTAANEAITVPSGVGLLAQFIVSATELTTAYHAIFGNPNDTISLPTADLATFGIRATSSGDDVTQFTPQEIQTSDGQVRHRWSGSKTFNIAVTGWVHPRGK